MSDRPVPETGIEAYREELAERVRKGPLSGFDRLAAERYMALCRIVTEASSLEEAQQIAQAALDFTEPADDG